MKREIPVRSHTRRQPGPSADFIAKTKALAADVLTEREWNEFVGNVLAMELDDVLSELDMDEAQRERIRESF
jgi:hypothetical protein